MPQPRPRTALARVLVVVCVVLLASSPPASLAAKPHKPSAHTHKASTKSKSSKAKSKSTTKKATAKACARTARKAKPKTAAKARPKTATATCALPTKTSPSTGPAPAPTTGSSKPSVAPSTRSTASATSPLGAAATPAPAPVATPAPGSMLWGAWNDRHLTGTLAPWDMSSVDVFERSIGKKMSLLHFAVPFTGGDGKPYNFPTGPLESVRQSGAIPFLSWSTLRSDRPDDPDYSPAAVAGGRQDEAIRAFADAARSWGRPFFLRFDYEMNGGWFPWGSKYGSNRPSDVVAMWRHVHDVFTSEGATNATWVWCPVADPMHIQTPVASLYPGNAYVDWTCLDGYNTDTPRRSFQNVIGSTYDEITALAPNKPMVIGETGSTERGGDKAQWISDMFASLPGRFPAIRALSWFNKNASPPYDQMALDTSAAATAAFARGVAPSRYLANSFASLTGPTISAMSSRVSARQRKRKSTKVR
jgi:hypothetical protein